MRLGVTTFDSFTELDSQSNHGQSRLNYQRNLDRPSNPYTKGLTFDNCMAPLGRLRLKKAEIWSSLPPAALPSTLSPVRWSLRNQILLPMAGLMLVTLLGVSALNVYLAVQRTRNQIESQLRDVTRTIVEATFPLTDNVLRQMHGLSGAELVVVSESGQQLAGSTRWDVSDLPSGDSIENWSDLTLGQPILMAGQRYFHSDLTLARTAREAAHGNYMCSIPKAGIQKRFGTPCCLRSSSAWRP